MGGPGLEEKIKTMSHESMEAATKEEGRSPNSAETSEEVDRLTKTERVLWETQNLLAEKEAELEKIYSSKGWKLLVLLWSVRLKIAPHGSFRATVIRKSLTVIKDFHSNQQDLWKKLKENALAIIAVIKNTPTLVQHIFKGWKEDPERLKMSWSAYTFYRYTTARQGVFGNRLGTLQNPRIPGKVSVVLPVHNAESSLSETIAAIRGQTYQNFELIIVGDGSCDQTQQTETEYGKGDARVKFVCHQDPRLSALLNHGFRHADGEFFTWLRAGIRIMPDFLAKLVDCLQRHPNVDMVYANMNIIGDHGQILQGSPLYVVYPNPSGSGQIYLPPDVMELNVVPENFVGVAFLYRSRMDFLLGDYSLNRCGSEDYDYWMRMNTIGTIRHTDFHDFVGEYPCQAHSPVNQERALDSRHEDAALMVFEEARRDFYLAPVAWVLEAGSDLPAQGVTRKIRAWIEEAGHLLLDSSLPVRQPDYRWWLPLVAVRVASGLNDAKTSPNWPEHAFKVLVQVGLAELPLDVSPDWDLCISAQELPDPPPRLTGPRQGWLAAKQIATLCTAIDARVKQAHLAELESRAASEPAPQLKFSVVICTYRRGTLLKEAILSVARQSAPHLSYEIIIVNNDPEDTMVSEMVEEVRGAEFTHRPEHLREVSCPFRGISFARNAGISEARGKIVSFLDDDAIAFPDWLEQIDRTALAFPQAGVIGGSILLDIPKPRPHWLKKGWEHYWSDFQVAYREPRIAEDWGSYPWGANWSALRQALLEIGGFRTKYGRSGKDFAGGEEVVAAFLVRRLGYEIVVAPAAQVVHTPDKNRYSLKHIHKTIQTRVNTCYQMQIDLYAPLIPNIDQINDLRKERLAQAHSKGPLNWHFRLEHWLFAQAYRKLIRRMRKDLQTREKLAEARIQGTDR